MSLYFEKYKDILQVTYTKIPSSARTKKIFYTVAVSKIKCVIRIWTITCLVCKSWGKADVAAENGRFILRNVLGLDI